MFKANDLPKVGLLATGIENNDALFLNYWLSKFVIVVAKQSGEIYSLKIALKCNALLKKLLKCKCLILRLNMVLN